MNFIELFAGCGGLSLGLKSVGFDLLLANELSPMAAETYAYNFFGEDFQIEAFKGRCNTSNVFWLSSQFGDGLFKYRLRENPFQYPALGSGYSDVLELKDYSSLRGGMVVGSIVDLNKFLSANNELSVLLKNAFGEGEVDVVSGGPPCQSFSMAGLRRQDCDKNSLPWEFAKLVSMVQPKIVLLENVTGILRPFKDEKGDSYYAWFELAKAFAGIDYIPLCLHVNAKYAGVPQNRPRFILVGLRLDVYKKLKNSFSPVERSLLKQPYGFYKLISKGINVTLKDLDYLDIEKNIEMYRSSFLRPLVASRDKIISVKDAIDDLRIDGLKQTEFSNNLSEIFRGVIHRNISFESVQNHVLRKNSDLVRRRFRIYQVLSLMEDGSYVKEVEMVLKGESESITDACWEKLSEFDFIVESGSFAKFNDKKYFVDFLKRHPTKKQTQKALVEGMPAPAALSIPDDACHYHHDEQRTLTVREMARIQSFPDEFEFRSKVTTGGDQRKFEVPQYTQVGNAVPPLLGRALGLVLKDLLARLPDRKPSEQNYVASDNPCLIK